jgi:Putative collagen-binding domain of a collagenase
VGRAEGVHDETLKWVERSREAGRPWFVDLDEIGPAEDGVLPDAEDPDHDAVRHNALWGNLMAGGGGCEWYFGYKHPDNDLDAEDFRSRERMWDQARVAVEFFRRHLPFTEMEPRDAAVTRRGAWCLAKPGEVYAVYLPEGGSTELDLGAEPGVYDVYWLDPRTGGDLQRGAVARVNAPGVHALGAPPSQGDRDWAVLVRRAR